MSAKLQKWCLYIVERLSLLKRKFAIGILVIGSVVFGFIPAVFPASLSAQLMLLIAVVIVFVAALLSPDSAVPPYGFMRKMLFALIFISVVWPEYLVYSGLPGPGVTPTRLIFWMLFGVWVYWFVVSRDLRQKLNRRFNTIRPFGMFLMIYVVWAYFCSFISSAPVFSIHYFTKLMLGPFLLLLFSLTSIRNSRDVDFVFFILVGASLVSCLIGFVEVAAGKNIFYDLVPKLVGGGDDQALNWVSMVESSKATATGSFRIWSSFTNPLTFSEFIVLSFPLAVYIVAFTENRLVKVIGLLTATAVLISLVYSQVRSALIAAVLIIVILVLTLGLRAMRQKKYFGLSILGAFSIILLCVSVFAGAGIAMDMVLGRNAAEAGSSFARVIMLERGVTHSLDSPIWGYGPGMGASTIGYLPGFKYLTIDSYYLSSVLETGFPGLLLFVCLLVFPVSKGMLAGFRASDKDSARIVVICSAVIGFSVIRSVLSLTNNFWVVFLLIGLLVVTLESDRQKSTGKFI